MSFASQSGYRVRFEWGLAGATALQSAEATVVVDVLSFTTSVDIVVGQGGKVYPFPYNDLRAEAFAKEVDAELAAPRSSRDRCSLSPASLVECGLIRIVLPSPNGSEITTQLTRESTIFAACLRNAKAVATELRDYGSINVIAAGERWPDGTTRFAVEDLIGAGAVISGLEGSKSAEARLAEAAYHATSSMLVNVLLESTSGRELVERDFERDVRLAAALDSSDSVPILRGKVFEAG